MWRFLQQDYAQKQDRFIWLVSRLGDWRYGLWNEKKYIPRECFQRLRQRGIDIAYITGYSGEANGLCEKLGPCKHKQWFHYELG